MPKKTKHLHHFPLVDGARLCVSAKSKPAVAAVNPDQHRLALALEASGGATWEWDLAANRLDIDARYRELYGFAPDAPVTFDTWLARIHPDDRPRLMDRLNRMLDTPGEDTWDLEFRVLHPRLGERWQCGLGRCYRDANGKIFRMAGVNLDITERRLAQELLQRSKLDLERLVAQRTDKLQELVNELEHFSYTLVHDMRAPLRAMRAFAELLRDSCEPRLDEKEKGLLQRIVTGAKRMDSLVLDALNYSKVLRRDLALSPIDVGVLLDGLLETYPQFQDARSGITLLGPLPAVMANEAGLTQCLSNLLSNAIKFVPPGRPPAVRIWADLRGEWVRFWVEDNGIGISSEMLPRVFHMFSHGSCPQAGTGIGLALVRKLVDRMGGRVGVESELGKGSRFWLDLRAAPHQPALTSSVSRVGERFSLG